jgi:hypothetical protein
MVIMDKKLLRLALSIVSGRVDILTEEAVRILESFPGHKEIYFPVDKNGKGRVNDEIKKLAEDIVFDAITKWDDYENSNSKDDV